MTSNNPGGRLWVDPDGVEGLGKAYEAHVQLYETYLAQLTALRARYANAWGDDDMGEQFSTKFLEGMKNLEAIIGGVKGTLHYTAEGLKESGRAYREADEAAAEVGRKMAKDFDGLEGLSHLSPALASRALNSVAESDLHRAVAEPAGPATADLHTPMQPLLRTETLHEATPNAAQPAGHPAVSSYAVRPEYATAYVGGAPLSGEYRLIALNPFDDGSTRVDANLYDSITPLAGTPVTTPDGTPIAPGQGQFFVVKENPAVDPTVPGYQPLYLSYSPDGTPTPIIPGA